MPSANITVGINVLNPCMPPRSNTMHPWKSTALGTGCVLGHVSMPLTASPSGAASIVSKHWTGWSSPDNNECPSPRGRSTTSPAVRRCWLPPALRSIALPTAR
ncbi:hypothetical protein FHT08_002936 [Xanthomonas campestris]|nr:hypothetical protein [Xanthomonas sp. CFBP 8152]NIJ77816.1 hypothetical protein [Xanthomonas sp. CFBP 8151]